MSSPTRVSDAAPRASEPDWTSQAADTIESVVGSIRNKTAVPLETIARALVYGVLILVIGGASLVLLTVMLVRLLALAYDDLLGVEVWAAHLTLGGLFTLGGLLLWRMRRPPAAER